MKATAQIELPTGVEMGGDVSPFVDREHATGAAIVKITQVAKNGATIIVVYLEFDVDVLATFVGDRGRGNPSVAVRIDAVPE